MNVDDVFEAQSVKETVRARFDGRTWKRADGGKWPDLYSFAYPHEITGWGTGSSHPPLPDTMRA